MNSNKTAWTWTKNDECLSKQTKISIESNYNHTHTRMRRKESGKKTEKHNNNNITYIYDKAVSKLTIPRYVKVNAVLLDHWLTVIWFSVWLRNRNTSVGICCYCRCHFTSFILAYYRCACMHAFLPYIRSEDFVTTHQRFISWLLPVSIWFVSSNYAIY